MSDLNQPRVASTPVATGWVGWIWFAALILVLVGTYNLIQGLAAIFEDDVFTTTSAGLLVLDLTAWGWVHTVVGALQVLVGLAMFSGATWPRVIAIILVMINAVAQLAWLNAHPVWSVMVIVLDVLVLWALVVHGAEAREGMAV